MSKRISKIQKVLNIGTRKLEKMDRSEIAKTVSILASAGNKRLRSLEKTGYVGDFETPAYRYTMRNGGNFSVAGKNKEELIQEFKRVKGFLNAKTSTISGTKQSQKDINKVLEDIAYQEERRKADILGKEAPSRDKFKYEMTKEELKKYWETVDMLRQMPNIMFNDICLQYVGKIEKYITKGRTVNQSRSYIVRAIEQKQMDIIRQSTHADRELQKYLDYDANEYKNISI